VITPSLTLPSLVETRLVQSQRVVCKAACSSGRRDCSGKLVKYGLSCPLPRCGGDAVLDHSHHMCCSHPHSLLFTFHLYRRPSISLFFFFTASSTLEQHMWSTSGPRPSGYLRTFCLIKTPSKWSRDSSAV
jgi:hypothetical protein